MNEFPSRLPSEIRTMIFEKLPLGSLTSISLVCRTWQILIFPYLHHTIQLSNVAHLEVLAKRLLENNTSDSLSVSAHLRCLKLGGGTKGWIRETDIHYLDTIIPKLTHINCLYWEISFMPKNFHWFSVCPELKSVHLLPRLFTSSDEEWMKRLPALLQFRNLTHFSLCSYNLPHGFNERDNKLIEPLTSLLQASPNLESIILDIQGEHSPYSPTLIIEPLGNQFIFPQLHTFHMLGEADPDWSEFISKATHPLREFFARHPSIRDLGIGYPLEDVYVSSNRMDPNNLSRLLPFVKHLACPLFLCEVVVTSKLGLQLESLAITNPSLAEDDDDAPFDLLAQVMTEDSLPNLRKLAIWDDLGYYLLKAKDFEAFFIAAKGLEELECRMALASYNEFLSALGGAPNLRCIWLDRRRICDLDASAEDWISMMVELAGRCPLLETIVEFRRKQPWRISRDSSGRPTVVKVERNWL